MNEQIQKIGLIGGLSPESTVHYYQNICRRFNERAGGLNFPNISIESINLQPLTTCFSENNWTRVAEYLLQAMDRLAAAGADFAAILANTPHNAWNDMQDRLPLPVLTIMEATADRLLSQNLNNVAILGTLPTMECGFFRDHFENRGIRVHFPTKAQRRELDRIIWEELSYGTVNSSSKDWARATIRDLEVNEIDAIVLGCTELSMLIGETDSRCPQLDTLTVHAEAILQRAFTEPSDS